MLMKTGAIHPIAYISWLEGSQFNWYYVHNVHTVFQTHERFQGALLVSEIIGDGWATQLQVSVGLHSFCSSTIDAF